jgi:glucose/arabinose dehydrogenase
MSTFRRLVVATLLVTAGGVSGARADGPTKLSVRVDPALSLQIVASGLQAPRGLAAVSDDRVFVTEFSWTKGQGRVTRLDRTSSGRWTKTIVFRRLDRPFGITIGPDAKVYVGEAGTVFRFDPSAVTPKREDVIGGRSGVARVPSRGLHPLTQVLFLSDRSLLVGLGSDTNNCEKSKGKPSCPAISGPNAVAVVRRYLMAWPSGKPGAWSVVARGLRNSMGLAQHTSGTVLQVDNGRDDITAADPRLSDDLFPHDELNEIDLRASADFGWPHCYDNAVASPEFRSFACGPTKAPLRLLPAHSAPLGMTYWTGPSVPAAFTGRLVVSLHGYRDTGHRLVSFAVDAKGRPIGEPTMLIDDWGEKDLTGGESQALGGPVGLAPMPDGSLFVSDDRNNLVVALVPRSP